MAAALTDGQQIVFLASHDGMAIRFDENDVRTMGRPASGVRGMDLGKGDYIVGLAVTPKNPKKNGKSQWRGRIRGRHDPLGHRERLRQAHAD